MRDDPIVFIPGINCTGALFARQIAVFGPQRPVIVADHGRHADIGDLAAALLGELPERFVLAGLSMGGYVAFELLRRAPERISGLVLMDTSARDDTLEAAERRRRMIAIAERGRFDQIPELQIPTLLGATARAGETLPELVRAMARDTGPEAFVRQQRACLGRPSSLAGLSAIACPTLVVVGEEDAITPPVVARELAEGIPGARLAVVADCGHLAAIEQPEAVTGLVAGFLGD
jgi:Predicted hydrolases or acyltransferases (alpha/beta hydrolase superfamily)